MEGSHSTRTPGKRERGGGAPVSGGERRGEERRGEGEGGEGKGEGKGKGRGGVTFDCFGHDWVLCMKLEVWFEESFFVPRKFDILKDVDWI